MTLERLGDHELFETPTRFAHLNALRGHLGLTALEAPAIPPEPSTPTAGIEI